MRYEIHHEKYFFEVKYLNFSLIIHFLTRQMLSNKKTILILDGFKNVILFFYKVPLFACSLSIDSKSALKLPAPKPFAPIL